MFDSKKLDDLAKRLSDAVPGKIKDLQGDIQENFRTILQGTFAKMDLVTREEFDAQTGVLSKTRAKLEQLEQQVAALEEQLKK